MYLFIETLITVHTFIYSLSKCIFKTKMMVSNYNEIYLSFQCRVPIFCFAIEQICICCFCSVSQSCLTLCNPKNGSMPGFPVFTVSQSCSNSCPLSWRCHPTISSSVIPFSSCLQSFPASGSFPMSQFFVSGSQSIGASASASVLPMNTQDWFPLGLTCVGSLYFYLLNLTTVSRGKMKILLIRGECTLGQPHTHTHTRNGSISKKNWF